MKAKAKLIKTIKTAQTLKVCELFGDDEKSLGFIVHHADKGIMLTKSVHLADCYQTVCNYLHTELVNLAKQGNLDEYNQVNAVYKELLPLTNYHHPSYKVKATTAKPKKRYDKVDNRKRVYC